MPFIYHIISKESDEGKIEGKVLYPLNVLRDKYPNTYTIQAKKYINKKHIQELYIPQLKCYWGDVIHFSAIKPDTLVQTLASLGLYKKFSYYEIDPYLLNPKTTVVTTNADPATGNNLTDNETPARFSEYDPSATEALAYIPEKTIAYYKKKILEGKEPTLFLFIPHILYKGTLDVSKLSLKQTSNE